jgi:3D (Asp-Asp-Asp) domain-containing protein
MKSKLNKLYSKLAKKYAKIVVLAALLLGLLIPSLASADTAVNSNVSNNQENTLGISDYLAAAGMPTPKEIPKRVVTVTVTAYSSTPDQTDDTPCITANSFNLCKNNAENVVAANFLPFGTRVKMPKVFGDQEFYVQDRMNKRFSQRVDIWMKSRKAALAFGIQKIQVEIY